MCRAVLLAAVVAVMSGCGPKAKGAVLPQAGGVIQVQATSNTADRSLADAAESAGAVCQKRGGLYPAILDQKTEYVGNIPEAAAVAGTLPMVSILAKSTYKTTLHFRCE